MTTDRETDTTMTEPAYDVAFRPCIEVKGHYTKLSVRDYMYEVRRAPGLVPRAVAFWQISWALHAPPVEKLRTVEQLGTEWPVRDTQVRIFDEETYRAQMDRLLGLK